MDAVDRIIQKIREDAEWKVAEFRKETQEKIEKIRREELARWEQERAKLERDGKREAENIKSLIISRAHMEGKRELMDAREEVIDKVMKKIKIEARNSPMYEGYLRNAIIEAKSKFGDEFVLTCIPEDKATVESIVSEMGLKIKIEVGAVKYGGIIVKDKNGERSVDFSVRALIERRSHEIRREIVNMLFGGEHA